MANNWTTSQLAAIETGGSNILVSAAAGSGKTAVLVERIIRKITDPENPVSIDRLVVVTFTKAAAAEMKQRIRLELDRLIEENPSDQNLIRQQTLVNNARITTIDSFCLDIVRNYFTETDIDPSFRTADEGEIRLVENDVMNAMLEEYYTAASPEFVELVEGYGTGRDDLKVVDIILKIYKFARSYPWEDAWYDNCLKMYDLSGDFDENPCIRFLWENIKKTLSGYISKYENYLAVCESPDGPVEYVGNIHQELMALDKIINAETFEEMVKCVKNLEFERLKSCKSEKRQIVQDGRNELKEYIKGLQKTLSKPIEAMLDDIAVNRSAVAEMVALARDFSKRMTAEKRERNIIDFNDMEHLALDILVKIEGGEPVYSPVADSLSEFYEEILIDEYQDSNMLQEQILTAVSKSRRAECDGNIYMVGDVKQSIYRFRMACPELFMDKSRRYGTDGSDGVRIQLQNNFRSRGNILESTNRVFERIMTDEYGGIPYDDDAKLYRGADYAKSPDYIVKGDEQFEAVDFANDCTTEIHIFEKDASDLSSAEAEAQVIGEIIKNLMSTEDGKVHVVADKNAQGGYRPLRYSDIVIISRTIKDFAQIIVNSLMNMGIPAYTENSKGFFQVYEVRLMLSFLTVIDNPLNDIPMAAVMMSYFGQFTSKDMAHVRGVEKKKKLYEVLEIISGQDDSETQKNVSDELAIKIKILMELIENYRRKSGVMSVYDLLWDAMYSTGFYDFVGTMPSGERRQANLDILLQKAGDFEKTSYRGLFNFLRYVERLQTYDVELGEASVLTEKDDIVRVMSIHKSKGLEFPVVIVAGMGKRMDHKDAAGTVITHQTYGIGADVVRLDTRTKNSTVIKNAISTAIREEDTSEFMRILYVAMTRAREKLIMTGQLGSNLENAMSKWESQKDELLADDGGEGTKTYDYAQIDKCTSFLDMVMPVALISDENENDNTFSVTVHEEINDNGQNMEQIMQAEQIQKTEVPEYPYELKENVKSKVTVSELKEQLQDEDFEADAMLEDSVKKASSEAQAEEQPDIVPKFMTDGQQELKGNQRGTAYHRIMECLDFTKFAECSDKASVLQEIKRQLDEMLESKRVTGQQHECVEPKDIQAFVMSDIGARTVAAANAGKLHREQPFVYIDDDIPEQLVQGVIDMYFEEGGELVIVDYKTDRVSRKDGAKVLKERYSVQLDYYAKALGQITGLDVKEKVIYSYALKGCVEV
jgi:ATP-dependent helicase/nuclease subunit A